MLTGGLDHLPAPSTIQNAVSDNKHRPLAQQHSYSHHEKVFKKASL